MKGAPLFLTLGALALNVHRYHVLPQGCRKDSMPGSSGGGVQTVPPGRPTPQQSMSGLDLEELAEIGKVCSLPAPSREEIVGFLSGSLCPFLFFFFFLRCICFEFWLCWSSLRHAGATPRYSVWASRWGGWGDSGHMALSGCGAGAQ